jgi:hypothetical protein
MLISHETPISLLDTSRGYNDYDYCLVHLLPEHKEYFNFYKESVDMGRHVLLDNSIFELGEAYDSKEFAYWIKELRPTEYIIPDVLESSEGTIESFKKFTSTYKDELPGKTIGVIQGKTYKEIVDCYNYIAPRVDKVAISFDYSFYLNEWSTREDYMEETDPFPIWAQSLELNKWVRYTFGRIAILNRLYNDKILLPKPHHLLGCATPWEFKFYKKFPLSRYIDSIDTSNPIVAAILHKKYNPVYGLHEKWSVKLVDYIGANITKEQLELAFYNTTLFRKFCS